MGGKRRLQGDDLGDEGFRRLGEGVCLGARLQQHRGGVVAVRPDGAEERRLLHVGGRRGELFRAVGPGTGWVALGRRAPPDADLEAFPPYLWMPETN